MPSVEAISDDVEFAATRAVRDVTMRHPVQVSLGCNVAGVALPHANPSDPPTIAVGVAKRFLRTPPEPNRSNKPGEISLPNFIKFVKKFVQQFEPLVSGSDTSVETWLLNTNYPDWRKKQLMNTWNQRRRRLEPRDLRVKSFMKDETYPEYKHARGINSRTDAFKCAFGPIIKLIEDVVYKHPAFIKKIPVADRPAYIEKKIGREGAKYFWGDFTAFESHFTPEILRSVEFILYRHMVKYLPDRRDFLKLLDVVAGTNFCVYKWFTVRCEGRRMSGEMNTSLGNGFVNLCLLSYLFSVYGEEAQIVVEGDDSNSSFFNNCPTVEDFAKLGFTVKCGVVERLEEMSFCGLIYTKEDKINICDPLKALGTFGWAKMNYFRVKKNRLLDLLRMKGLSYAHQYPGCPIVQELAHYALRCTRGRDIRKFVERGTLMSFWEREQFLRDVPDLNAPPKRAVPMPTRLLCERMFGISIQLQIAIEDYLSSLNAPTELGGPISLLNFPVCWKDYYTYYHGVVSNQGSKALHPFFPKQTYLGFEPDNVLSQLEKVVDVCDIYGVY